MVSSKLSPKETAFYGGFSSSFRGPVHPALFVVSLSSRALVNAPACSSSDIIFDGARLVRDRGTTEPNFHPTGETEDLVRYHAYFDSILERNTDGEIYGTGTVTVVRVPKFPGEFFPRKTTRLRSTPRYQLYRPR